MELKSIGVLSCGKLMGAVYAVFGIIFGGLMAFFSLLGAAAEGQIQDGGNPLLAFGTGLGALIILPLLYGIGGFLGGIFSAFVYNLAASYIGGVELNFQQQQQQEY